MTPSRLQFALLSLAAFAWVPATLVRFTYAPANYLYATAALFGPLLFLLPKLRAFGFVPPIVIVALAAQAIVPLAEATPHRDELSRLTLANHELILKRQCGGDDTCSLVVEQRRQLLPGIEHRTTRLYAPNHPSPSLVPESATTARIAPTTFTVNVKPLWPF